MHIRKLLLASLLVFSCEPAFAEEHNHDEMSAEMMAEHGGGIFHGFTLETDYGASSEGGIATWDLDGWIGTDENKLWIKSEGDHVGDKLESAELWALYSRNIDTFWDAQAGIRYDFQPEGTSYFTLGLEGLAPYYFETEAHLFLSDEGDLSARLRLENDLLLTQKLILQPYAEINLYAQDVPEQDIGSGFSYGEIGLQTRYEITRKLAPYIDVRYEGKFGETASIAENMGEDKGSFVAALGLRLMF